MSILLQSTWGMPCSVQLLRWVVSMFSPQNCQLWAVGCICTFAVSPNGVFCQSFRSDLGSAQSTPTRGICQQSRAIWQRLRRIWQFTEQGLVSGSGRRVSRALWSRMAMAHRSVILAVVCLLTTSLAGAQATLGIVGGPKDIPNFANSVEIDELANFAVDQYKTQENSVADILFSKVLSAKEQVVQGTMYYLTIEVMEDGVAKQYDAKVWVKPWEGYKELESFLPSAPSHYDPAVDACAKFGDSHE